EPDVRLPRQLNQPISPVDEALGEVLTGHVTTLHDLARFESHLSQARSPVQARALEQVAIAIEQALCERFRIVRVRVDNGEAVTRGGRAGHRRTTADSGRRRGAGGPKHKYERDGREGRGTGER